MGGNGLFLYERWWLRRDSSGYSKKGDNCQGAVWKLLGNAIAYQIERIFTAACKMDSFTSNRAL